MAEAAPAPKYDQQFKIDMYNRGVRKKSTPEGVEVYMYIRDPGVFINAFGKPVGDELAAKAGFDVKELTKQKTKKDRQAAALKAIEEEYGGDVEGGKVVKKQGDLEVVDIGGGRHHIRDEDGNVLTPTPLPLESAEAVMKQMAKTEPGGIESPKDESSKPAAKSRKVDAGE